MEALNLDPPSFEINHKGLAMELVEASKAVVVDSQETAKNASDLTKRIKVAFNTIEDQRKSLVKPLNREVTRINGIFKNVTVPLEVAETSLKSKLMTHQRAQQRLEQERLEAERQEKLRLRKEAEEAGAPPPPTPIERDLPSPTTVRGEMGSVTSIKYRWVFELDDLALVPFAFLQINEKAVNAAIKSGAREIPGLKIWDEGTVSVG